MMTPQFWQGRRVFITGHTGFKGSWLSLWLQHLQAHVTGFSLCPPSSPSMFHAANVADGMEDIRGDVRDGQQVAAAIERCRPEVVIHMAAQPLVRQSYQDPAGTFSTNVMGTVNVLDAVRRTPSVRSVVVVTSDKCYENREWVWGYRESEPMGGKDPYSASKGCAELVTAAFRSSYFSNHSVGIATARAGNVIGGGDWADDRLIPDVVRALQSQRPVEIRNPSAVRPWQHVLEPLRGYVMLAERLFGGNPRWSQGWNFGPRSDDMLPVSSVVQEFIDVWGRGSWTTPQGVHPHEARILRLDCSKAELELGWTPRMNLHEAIRKTVEWQQQAIRDATCLRELTLEQIDDYSRNTSAVDRPTSAQQPAAA